MLNHGEQQSKIRKYYIYINFQEQYTGKVSTRTHCGKFIFSPQTVDYIKIHPGIWHSRSFSESGISTQVKSDTPLLKSRDLPVLMETPNYNNDRTHQSQGKKY